jgi:predicted nucleic acid-binding protein
MAQKNNKQIIVIDASVAIKFFIEEEESDKADLVLTEIINKPDDFVVPELFFFELANTLNRIITDDTDPRLKLLGELSNMGLIRIPFSPVLASDIRKFQTLGLSGYDSAYLAVASLVGGIWLTADKKAHNKVSALGISRMLEDK